MRSLCALLFEATNKLLASFLYGAPFVRRAQICRLSFVHSAPLDAITQFRKLIDFFKGKVGMTDVAFEHSAWMARQCVLLTIEHGDGM